MYPMMFPFILYQRWVEMVFLPFLDMLADTSRSSMDQAKSTQAEAAQTTKDITKYRG